MITYSVCYLISYVLLFVFELLTRDTRNGIYGTAFWLIINDINIIGVRLE